MNSITEQMELCYVVFLDTKLTDRIWDTKQKALETSGLAICEAAGFLLSQDNDELKITIAHGEGNVLDVLAIPADCILDFKIIPKTVYEAL